MLSPFAKSVAVSAEDLSFTLVALLRADGHLCNVLTHKGLLQDRLRPRRVA